MFDWKASADRHGAVGWNEVRQVGASRAQWQYAHQIGVLVAAGPKISVLADAPDTMEQRITVAVRSLGHGSLASHRSAIRVWGGPITADGLIDVIVARRRRPESRPGVVIHRPRDRGDLVASTQLGIRCTSPLRALLDLGAVIADAFVFHLVIKGFEVDFAFPDRRLIVETDGWEFHGSRDAFEVDRRRDAVLLAAGWRVLRVTWHQVSERPEWVVAVIRAALATQPT